MPIRCPERQRNKGCNCETVYMRRSLDCLDWPGIFYIMTAIMDVQKHSQVPCDDFTDSEIFYMQYFKK